MRRLSEEEKEQIKALYKKGLTIQDIAQQLDCCVNTVQKYTRRYQSKGIVKPRTHYIGLDTAKKIKEMWDSGKTLKEITETLSVSGSTVYRYRNADEQTFNNLAERIERNEKLSEVYSKPVVLGMPRTITDKQRKHLIKMKLSGMTLQQIADKEGMSFHTVSRICANGGHNKYNDLSLRKE